MRTQARKGGFIMKKCLCIFILTAVAGLCSVLFVFREVDKEKGNITVTETVLAGDAAEAEGVLVEIGTHWQGRLLWNTLYRPGHVQEASSSFDFSGQGIEWNDSYLGKGAGLINSGHRGGERNHDGRYVELEIISPDFGTALTSGKNGGDHGIAIESMPWPGVLQAAADRTAAGETRTVNLRVRDYYEYYPLELFVSPPNGITIGSWNTWVESVTEYFQFPIPEDESFQVTVRKDWDGEVVELNCHSGGEGYYPVTVSASGDTGFYFSYYIKGKNKEFEQVQREFGGQYAIYWLPFEDKERMSGADLEQMRAAAWLPEDALPVTMQYDRERRILYLLAAQREQYIMLTYLVEEGELTLLQQLEILSIVDAAGKPAAAEDAGITNFSEFSKMSVQEDGILLTWRDNGFVFLAGDGEAYRFWCGGIFPAKEKGEGVLEEKLPEGWYTGDESAFPFEHAFAFDGTRLALAAFEDWGSLDSRLLVYREGELVYSGCYRYSGALDRALGTDKEILPWGGNFKGRRRDGAAVSPVRVSIEQAAP